MDTKEFINKLQTIAANDPVMNVISYDIRAQRCAVSEPPPPRAPGRPKVYSKLKKLDLNLDEIVQFFETNTMPTGHDRED